MSTKHAHVYFYGSYCGKTHQKHDSGIFQLKIWILDKNNLFATLNESGILKVARCYEAVKEKIVQRSKSDERKIPL